MRDTSRWRRPEHGYADIGDIEPRRGEHIVSVQSDGTPALDAMVDFVGSDVTFVSFHAALSKQSFSMPYFTGATLAAKKANRILVSDPAVDQDVLLAWFAGSRAVSSSRIERFVDALIERAGAQHVVFFGGSGGGFAALNNARRHPGSTAVVANPQTDITRFYPRWWMNYGRRSWGLSGDQDEMARALHELGIPDLAEEYGAARPDVDVVYMQNAADEHHIEHHLTPFVEATGGRRLEVIEGDWGPGHARPAKERIVDVLDQVFDGLRSRERRR